MQRRRLREMHDELSRRDLLRLAGVGLSGLGLAAIVGCVSDDADRSPTSTPGIVVDPPPETTTIRLPKEPAFPRMAPFYLAGQFLPAEGFTDVQYIDPAKVVLAEYTGGLQQMVAGEIDIGMPVASAVTVAADASDQIVVLAGLSTSSVVLFGNDHVQSLRDLKGRRIGGSGNATGAVYSFMAALLAYVGIDVEHEVEFVVLSSFTDGIAQLKAGTVDAFLTGPPYSTELQKANIGNVVLNTAVDPPWSQYFRFMAAGNRDFVEKHPAATKRALRAILKATDVCDREPERAARYVVDKAFTTFTYDEVLDGITGGQYTAWREFEPEATMRFYALRLGEAGLVKSTPDDLIARATDWRFLNEIKRELAV